MDLKIDYVTLAILLYRARREIALSKIQYQCRNPRYCNMSYEQWKEWKKKIKKKKGREKSEID